MKSCSDDTYLLQMKIKNIYLFGDKCKNSSKGLKNISAVVLRLKFTRLYIKFNCHNQCKGIVFLIRTRAFVVFFHFFLYKNNFRGFNSILRVLYSLVKVDDVSTLQGVFDCVVFYRLDVQKYKINGLKIYIEQNKKIN